MIPLTVLLIDKSQRRLAKGTGGLRLITKPQNSSGFIKDIKIKLIV